MLYLHPPFHIISGVTVFADHADPRQFYYLPAVPHLATTTDPATGQEVPQIQLLRFTGLGEAGGGFLSFTVSLGVAEEVLDEVREEIKRVFDVDGQPRLAPVLLEDGAVRLMILGKETPDDDEEPPSPATAPDDASHLPEFVLKISHPAKPSLYGDNHAIFSVLLDEAGTTAVLASLEGHMMPVGIVYELEFLALRPAFNVRIHADWDRVQTHFQERTERRVFFFSDEVDEIVDELIEDRVIVIEVDNFLPEGEDTANVITNPTQVVNQIKEMLLETFFEPSLHPTSTAKDGWDKVSDASNRLSTLAVTGGWAGVATYSHKKVDLTRIDRKRFDFNLRERTTAKRRIYPQAHLEGLTRTLREDGLDVADFVVDLDGGDPFFSTRAVEVVNLADFEGDGIGSIAASLRYGDSTEHVALGAGTDGGSVSWPALLDRGQVVHDVAVSYTVRFTAVSSLERPVSVASGETTITGNTFDIAPADDIYHLVTVPVTALDFPWEEYPHVQVDLRYDDPGNGIAQDDRLILNAQQPTANWRWFLLDPEKDTFDYRVVFRAADHRDWTTDWITTGTADVLLRNPRPNGRTVTVVPAVSWDEVSRVFVDLAYHDQENGVRAESSLRFSREDAEPKDFSVALEDPDHRAVQYAITLLFADHTVKELPPSTTTKNQVLVRADMIGHRVVTVRPDQVDFAAEDVREVHATLRYQDEANALDFTSELVFGAPGERALFEFDYVDPDRREVTVDTLTVFTNGFTARWPTQSLDQDEVVLRVV